MPLEDMRIFAAVVENTGVRAAARALGIPRSSVSRRVVALEERLGAELMRREARGRGFALTEIGRAYYERCARVVAESHAADEMVMSANVEPRGTLRVTASQVVGDNFLDPVVAEYLRRWPAVHVEVRLTSDRLDPLEEGFDIAIRCGAVQDSSAIVARKLCQSERTCFASPDYLARRGAPESPDDLRSHECIVVASDIGPDPWIFGGRRGPEEVAVGGRLRVNSFRMAHQAALAGVGIVRIARFIAEADVSAGRLVEVLPAYRSVTDLVAVFAKSKPVPAKVRAFVDLLVDHFLRGAHGKRRR